MSALQWQLKTFDQLSLNELYDILNLRQQVFVVEQNCPYLDADGEDIHALHLFAYEAKELITYARIFHASGIEPTGQKANLHGADPHTHRIGRVAVALSARNRQLGRKLMQRAMEVALQGEHSNEIVIGAQSYLLNFYQSLGFKCEGEPYLEDDIPHQDMRFSANNTRVPALTCSSISPFLPALVAQDPELTPAAAKLASELCLPATPNEHDFVLQLTPFGLQLTWSAQPKVTPLRLDFIGGKQAWRRQAGGVRDEAIVRALGIQKGHRPDILDATAGLGRDGLILAHAGCTVRLLERNPAIHALLNDAVHRASLDPTVGHWVQERVRVLPAGSILQPEYAVQLQAHPPMAIYLDPMFPHREKSAAVKKDMQMVQALVGSDEDSDQLLTAALAIATHRVVVKRPAKAPFLTGQKPSAQVPSKKHRFDLYIKKAY